MASDRSTPRRPIERKRADRRQAFMLLLLEAQPGADVSASIGDSRDFRFVRNSKALKGAGLGFLISSVSLCMPGWLTDPEGFENPEGGGLLVVAVAAGIPGLLVGAGVGAILGPDEPIRCEGRSTEVSGKALKYLRKKARLSLHPGLPNFMSASG